MKVYVVQSSHGQYEDFHTEINGIYSTKEKANKVKQKIKASYDAIKNKPKPFKDIDPSEMTDEQYNELCEWETQYYDHSKYNLTWVTEFELDK